MNTVNAQSGWTWVKQGFALFRKQPAEMLTLFFAYMFLNMTMGFIPVLGQFLPLMLLPVFAIGFMQACRQIELGQRVYPGVLLTGFRSPALPRLLVLGVLYIIAATLSILASSQVDGGAFWDFVTSQKPIDPKTLPETGLFTGMLVSGLVYIPALMAFWYASPLIVWQKMPVAKAVFYSFFAVQRAYAAFTMYGLGWIAIGVLLPTLISVLIAVIIGKAFAVMLAMMPVSIVLSTVMYCSFYPTYTDVFGKPDEENQPAA
ncbi:BPSS1780 family membrane protein [Undibacterium pigrum]|uniref:Transmembrane protein n=1 Tax=Undibacterium pigrum TaxID=401470 RepID=A0A318J784_9BURK|nr:BPSS1780 family membrane protein [Undibacterium pigrum]PXX43905.1 hypothetical protein DFR42_103173 [Undibacterium pigrum]